MQPEDIDDFKDALKRHNYLEKDFSIKEKDATDWKADSIVPIKEIITVKNLKNGKEKCYNSGDGINWVDEFEKDLKKGSFS